MARYEKSYFDKNHDHVIFTDSGEVKEFCDPRIQIIKKTIEDIFDIDIHNHSLYFYGTKKKKSNKQHTHKQLINTTNGCRFITRITMGR